MNNIDLSPYLIDKLKNNVELKNFINVFEDVPTSLSKRDNYADLLSLLNYKLHISKHYPILTLLKAHKEQAHALDISGWGYTSYICSALGYNTRFIELTMRQETETLSLKSSFRKALGVHPDPTAIDSWNDLNALDQRGFQLVTINADALGKGWGIQEWEFFLSNLAQRMSPAGLIYLYKEIYSEANIWENDRVKAFLFNLGGIVNRSGSKMIFENLSRLRIALPLTSEIPATALGRASEESSSRKGDLLKADLSTRSTIHQIRLENTQALIKWLADLPEDKFVVGLFIGSSSLGQDEWMNPLAVHFRNAGYVTVGLISRQAYGSCALETTDVLTVMDTEDVQFLSRINIFVILDSDGVNKFPKNSKVVGFIHGFTPAIVDTCMAFQTHLPKFLDAFVCCYPLSPNSRKMTEELWEGLVNKDMSWREIDDFYIIQSGYPRAAALAEAMAVNHCKRDSIIYAPINMDYDPNQGGNRIENYGYHLIKGLLENFPEFNIIFRPFIKNISAPQVQKLKAEFANNPRFIFDISRERIGSFSRGIALITDFSHVMNSFAFTTLHSAWYYHPWIKKKAKYILSPGGGFAYTLEGLTEAIKKAIANEEKTADVIRKDRDRIVMPLENTFEEITSFLPKIVRGEPEKSWLKIVRRPSGSIDSQVALIKKILGAWRSFRYPLAWKLLITCNSRTPLLAGFAIHMGKKHAPNVAAWPEVYEHLSSLLGQKIERAGMAKIDDSVVRFLYEQSRRVCMADFNLPALQLIESLIDDFETLIGAAQNQPV